MTLEEAIKHCKDVALSCTNKECALEHFQLLKWLQEYSNMLEKQDEQKPFDYENANIQQKDFAPNEDKPRYSIGDVLCDKSCTTLNKDAQPNFEIVDIKNGMYICDKCSFPISQQDEYELVAKKIEQKPADKAEPKFHEGEWITNGDYTWKIVEVKPLDYILQSQNGNIVDDTISHVDEQFHSFTIQDAKDGDVLYSDCLRILWIFKNRGTVYCGCNLNYNDGAFSGEGYIETPTDAIPATKSQRDTLFAKMREAGYEFDFEKKELKKIEFNPDDLIEESHQQQADDLIDMVIEKAWSEDDELELDNIIDFLNSPSTAELCPTLRSNAITWLKSLKERITWEPQRMVSAEAKEVLYDKPATWSKEDKDYYDAIIAKLEVTQDDAALTDNQMEFLKSLKDKIQSQPKQEWSEDDEELAQAKKDAYNDALDKIEYHSGEPTFDDGWSAAIWYLKKRNAIPQPHWKPSEEQMEALWCAAEYYIEKNEQTGIFYGKVLESLYDQLKQL